MTLGNRIIKRHHRAIRLLHTPSSPAPQNHLRQATGSNHKPTGFRLDEELQFSETRGVVDQYATCKSHTVVETVGT